MVTELNLPRTQTSLSLDENFFLLPMVPCASSPVTLASLAFRARFCAKNEAPGRRQVDEHSSSRDALN